jgi:hypothetical protein
MPTLHVATAEPLQHILENLREADRLEFEATPMFASHEAHAKALAGLGQFAWVAYTNDGEPVFAIGAWGLWPGVCSLWSFGTERTPEVILPVTRHVMRFMIPKLLELGFHRGECRALASRTDMTKWFDLLGFKQEAVCSGFGSGREDFILYAWTADATRKPS